MYYFMLFKEYNTIKKVEKKMKTKSVIKNKINKNKN